MKKQSIRMISLIFSVIMISATGTAFAGRIGNSESLFKRECIMLFLKHFTIEKSQKEYDDIRIPLKEEIKRETITIDTHNSNLSSDISSYKEQVVELVNKERSEEGLYPLAVSMELSDVAQTKAEDMRDKGYFSHTSHAYGSPFEMIKTFGIKYTLAGENIAKGQRTPESVMNAWMNSQGHRANILNASYEKVGIGYCKDENGNTYWVQMFIK